MQPAFELPAVEYAERSDPGRDPAKQVNEDVCVLRETRLGYLCIVCDGMGGHAAGREAAQLAAGTIIATFDQAPEGVPPALVLRAAIEEASRRVYSLQTDEVALGRPGSTVVAILMHSRGTEVAHVGDSRAYLVHEGQIYRLTRDHSVVQDMVDRGLLTPQQASQHPDSNRITRALGVAAEVEVEVMPQPVEHVAGDAFILCSDGLSDLVDDLEILAIVGTSPAAQAAWKLVDLANARGGHDNVTVTILRARTSADWAGWGTQAGGLGMTVAQTVHQTGVTQPHGSVPPSPTFAAFPEARDVLATEVPAYASPPIPSVPPVPSRRAVPAPPLPLVVGLVVAFAAAGVLAMVLTAHFLARSGTHNASSEASGALLPAAPRADAGVAAPAVSLIPQSPEVPVTTATGPSIAPLESSPALEPPHGKKKR